MALLTRRSYAKLSKCIIGSGKYSNCQKLSCIVQFWIRRFGNDSFRKHPEFINSTILVEDGLNVRELPVVVRKVTDLTLEEESSPDRVTPGPAPDNSNYHLIQAEFRQCVDLRDIFSLLSKCIKITPNIALGAMERICELEKNPILPAEVDVSVMNAHLAKGAIVEKLLKVVMQTEDTQTLLNALNTESLVLEPYKHRFCDELLIRVIDNRLSISQICEFISFLGNNRKDKKYDETIDKLWVGFVERQDDINEKNIVQLLNTVHYFKASKSTIMLLLEKKLWSFWWKLNVGDMQEILNIFIRENNLSLQSLSIVGRWLNTNIHVLDEDSLLDIITKLTRLQYTDLQVESAIERYVKSKGVKIESQVLIVAILNYCMAFRIRNKNILNGCSKYFVASGKSISHSFLKSFISPFGILYYNPENRHDFWKMTEIVLKKKFSKLSCNDILEILLSSLYLGQHQLKFVDMMFHPEFLNKLSQSDNAVSLEAKLYFLDTALSLECPGYCSPFPSNEQWPNLVPQDIRIKRIIKEMVATMQSVANGNFKVSQSVSIPHLCPNEAYVIDFLLHPVSLDADDRQWITKCEKNKVIAMLIHLPEHYCYNSNQLVGSQMMRKKHLRLFGMRVVSLSYTVLSKLEHNKIYLQHYINNCLENAELFL